MKVRKTHIYLQNGWSICETTFDLLDFHHTYKVGYIYISDSGLNKCNVQNSFDNLIKFFMIHKIYRCLCIKLISMSKCIDSGIQFNYKQKDEKL